jgi:hypothetical protein
MQLAIKSREESLNSFIDRAVSPDVPQEIQGHLYRYGAILVCGNIEQCIKLILLDRLTNRAHKRVINFVKNYLDRGQNLDCKSIEDLLNRFEPAWGKALKDFVDSNNDIKEGISSAYSVRNPIAHGSPASLGSARLREIFDISKRLIEGVIQATS